MRLRGKLLDDLNDALILHWSLSLHRQPELLASFHETITKALADARDEALEEAAKLVESAEGNCFHIFDEKLRCERIATCAEAVRDRKGRNP